MRDNLRPQRVLMTADSVGGVWTYALEFTGRVIPNGRTHAQFSPAPKLSRIFAAGRVWDEAKNISLLSEIAPRVSWPIDVAGEDRHPGGGSPRLANVNLLGRLTQPQLA